MAGDVLRQQISEFVLGDARRDHRHFRWIDPGGGQRVEQADVAVAVDRAEHAVGPRGLDQAHCRPEIPMAQWQIHFPGRPQAFRGHVFLGHEIGRPRKDVVRSQQEDLFLTPAGVACEPIDDRQDLLVGHHPAIDDVGRRLVSLVLHRIEEQAVALLDDRQHRLAARTRPAAKQSCGAPVD